MTKYDEGAAEHPPLLDKSVKLNRIADHDRVLTTVNKNEHMGRTTSDLFACVEANMGSQAVQVCRLRRISDLPTMESSIKTNITHVVFVGWDERRWVPKQKKAHVLASRYKGLSWHTRLLV